MNMKHMKALLSLLVTCMLLIQCVSFAESGWSDNDGILSLTAPDGAPVTGWYLENGEWFYLDEAGTAVTGSFEVRDGLYTADEQGHVTEGWMCLMGVWHELKKSEEGNEGEPMWKWVYVESDDTVPAKTIQNGDQEIEVKNTEDALIGWVPAEADNARYFEADGSSDIGWKTIEDNTYFFTPDGRAASGKVFVDGQYYAFSEDGIVEKNTYEEIADVSEVVATPTDLAAVDNYDVRDVTETEIIHFETKYKHDNNRYEDEGTIVLQKGEDGEKLVTYEVVTKNGEEVSRSLKSEMVTKEPVERILSVPKKPHVIEEREETVEEAIPFETEIQNDNSRVKGEPDQIAQEGVNGVREIVYTVTYTDGTETARSVKSEKVTKKPVKKIINVAIGEKLEYTTSHVTNVEIIPHTSKTIETDELPKGETTIAQKGVDGEKEIVYAIKKDLDGNVISKEVVSEKVTKEMQEEIIKVGTKEPELHQEEPSEAPVEEVGEGTLE